MDTPDASEPDPPLGAGFDLADPNSPLAPYYLSSSQVAAALVLTLVTFFYAIAPLWHTDVWGHLRFGEWIAQYGSSPTREPFCEFSDQSIPLINFPWLTQLAFCGAFRAGEAMAGGDEARRLAGGVAGLRTLSLLFAVATSVFLLLACRRASGSWLVGALGLLAYNVLAPSALGVLRPQLAGMALFAFFLWILASPSLSWRGVLALAIGSALWANLHGSFVMGLALIGAHLGGRLLERTRTGGRWTPLAGLADPQARMLLAALVLAGLAATLNPSGPWLYYSVLTFGRNPTLRTFDEFRPLDLEVGPLALVVYVFAGLLLAGSWLLARRKPTATDVLLILLFGILPIMQRRMLVWWMPIVPLLAAPVWADLLRRWRGDAELPGVPNLRYTVMGGLLAVVALAYTQPVQALLHGPAPLAQSVSRGTPWELALTLEGEPLDGERAKRTREGIAKAFSGRAFFGRIFASETAADFLVWRRPIPAGVLAYTHIHLFGMDHWRNCMTVKSGGEGWDALLDRWGVNLIVVESATHPDLCRAVSRHPAWRVLEGRVDSLEGPPATLFVAVRKQPLGP